MTEAIRRAYSVAAPAWRQGPERVYAALADVLVEEVPLAGATVLDAGAGTGVAGDAALRRGAARVVAVDLAAAILPRPPAVAVAADLARLPFAGRAFDLAVAAFSIGHLPAPEEVLVELRRVAPLLVASAFAEGWTHPAKQVVDRVLAARGYRPPPWYDAFKDGSERRVGDPDRLADLTRVAGYAEVAVRRVEVDTGVGDPAALAAWRLGMAHHAPFVAGLAPDDRDAARDEAEVLLSGAPPVVVPMLVLTAT